VRSRARYEVPIRKLTILPFVLVSCSAFGGINHIINNAGFTFDKMLHTSTDDGYRLMLEVHNVAPFRIVREAAPYLRAKKPEDVAKNKSIVNVSSVAGEPYSNFALTFLETDFVGFPFPRSSRQCVRFFISCKALPDTILTLLRFTAGKRTMRQRKQESLV